jgi:hypothetical protein
MLLRTADANDAKYLIQINVSAILKNSPPPSDATAKKTYYLKVQQEAKNGPIFSERTINFVSRLPNRLEKNVVKWLANCYEKEPNEIEENELAGIVDYVAAENPNLENRSWSEVLDSAHNWHIQFRNKAGIGSYKTKVVVHNYGNGYTMVKVPVEDLKTEGDLMGHCVGGYTKYVREGECTIYSLRDKSNKPHVTIEIDKRGVVVQIQGKENSEPVSKYHDMIVEWVESNFKHNKNTVPYIRDPAKIRKIVHSKDLELLIGLARNIYANESVFTKLIETKNPTILTVLASNPSVPPNLLSMLSKETTEWSDVANKLLDRDDLTSDVLDNLALNSYGTIRRLVAKYKHAERLSDKTIRLLSNDAIIWVRTGLLLNENVSIPESILVSMAKLKKNLDGQDDSIVDNYLAYFTALAKHPNTTLLVLSEILSNPNECLKVRALVSPKIPIKVLEKFNKSPISNLSDEAIATNDITPPNILDDMIYRSYPQTCVNILQNKSTSEQTTHKINILLYFILKNLERQHLKFSMYDLIKAGLVDSGMLEDDSNWDANINKSVLLDLANKTKQIEFLRELVLHEEVPSEVKDIARARLTKRNTNGLISIFGRE